MKSDSFSQQKAQLDKAERERLEEIVEKLRSRVEDNIRFQLTQKGLDHEPENRGSLDNDRRKLVDAIDIERAEDATWKEAFDEYTAGVGYTIVNRLAALRCMEVRDFIDEEVTVFKQNGLTPAAEALVREEFLLEDEAILTAYHNACDELADEIEILFNRSSAYGLIDPDDDTFEEVCGILDEIPNEVWRADDVLGWIYEYYNRPVVEELDAKNTLEPEDIGPANQFYTPHWVVRMLADNSLGKLYLEASNKVDSIPERNSISPEDRKDRLVTPEESPSVPELCTYLIPDEEPGDAPEFDHPRELRVIDPACGSGHFLLYAFDILERIWWAETDVDRAEIPAKVLDNNLYGVDIDLRSCQLSAFNLYLKARTRAEAEDGRFEMPNVGIVCADARVAEVEEATNVLSEITGEGGDLQEALDEIIETFQHTEALGSLLNVSGSLEEVFEASKTQAELTDYDDGAHQSLNSFLRSLQRAVEKRTSDSFGERNLRSFLNLLVVLTQEYDVSLMNPPYGSGGRMPNSVKNYISDNYNYKEEYYINFFEACDRRTKTNGRTGMLVPRSFMFLKTFQDFREDFIGGLGGFDFLAEYGIDVLDNATVRTAGTVVRSDTESGQEGTFIRLDDVEKADKQYAFLNASFDDSTDNKIQRLYERNLDEFDLIPGTPLSYWVSKNLRQLYTVNCHLDAQKGGVGGRSLGEVSAGLCTGDDGRFVREFWEAGGDGNWVPFAKGGSDAWLLPRVNHVVNWAPREIGSQPGGRVQNTDNYFSEALSYTVAKESGRRFGYLHSSSIFSHKGSVLIPTRAIWQALSFTNSHLFTYLMLSQTTERMWEIGLVSKAPWKREIENIDQLEKLAKEAVGHLISKRQYEFTSPHYNGPILLDVLGTGEALPAYEHPHKDMQKKIEADIPAETVSPSNSINDMGVAAANHIENIEKSLQSCADTIDKTIFDCFDISESQQETILQEIALRTNEDPRNREEYDTNSITKPGDDFPEQVRNLLLHFALRAVNEKNDGIIPVSTVGDEDDLLTHIEHEFQRVWGEHADARLAEVDGLLGDQRATNEAYPNLQSWLKNDLFDYHVTKFNRTPILWQVSTRRLVSDPQGEGFACFIDYQQLDKGVFDRLRNRYLEPRKGLLRERRSAANRRQSDNSLSASEQAEAAEEYACSESGLEQVAVLEDRLVELAQSDPREWSSEEQQIASGATDRVIEFRRQTQERLEIVDDLAAMEDVDMADLFTGNFYKKVKNQREEWIEGLNDLRKAFETYAADSSEPVEAHMYDMFNYYLEDLLGTSHFASNGILYMTYYFDKFEQADQVRLENADGSLKEQLKSQLANNLDDYIELGESIAEDCSEVSSGIPSDWADRALSEITTRGYQPNRKHGVDINIIPLVQAEIVPKKVEDDVL